MVFRKLSLLFLLACSAIPHLSFGQSDGGSFSGAGLRAGVSWHPDDLSIGAGGGIRIKKVYRVGAEFYSRPGYRSMIYERGSGKVQYQEKSYAALLYAERAFTPEGIRPFQGLLGLSGGRTWEVRKGFPAKPFSHWSLIPRIGAGYPLGERFRVELEYRYAAQPAINAKEHRIGLRTVCEL